MKTKNVIFVGLMLTSIIACAFSVESLKKSVSEIDNCRYTADYAKAENGNCIAEINGLEILCNCKTMSNSANAENMFVFYNENQYLIYDTVINAPVFFSYCSRPSVRRYTINDCLKEAERVIASFLPKNADIVSLKYHAFYDGCYRFTATTSDAKEVILSVRADTAKISYYDASELWKIS